MDYKMKRIALNKKREGIEWRTQAEKLQEAKNSEIEWLNWLKTYSELRKT